MVPRRSVSEWITAIEISPQIRYLFVEGKSDANLIGSFVIDDDLVEISPIENVPILATNVVAGFLGGNRCKLVRFSEKIEATGGLENAKFLIDRDFEDHRPTIGGNPSIFLTDSANLPVCFLDYNRYRENIFRMLGVVIEEQTWNSTLDCCKYLFALRLWKANNYPSTKIPDLKSDITVAGNIVSLDIKKLIGRLHSAGGIGISVNQIVEEVAAVEATLSDNWRLSVRSHDFFALVFKTMRTRRELPQGWNIETLEKLISASYLEPCADQHRVTEVINWLLRR